ncbi:replication-relaxation family protein [Edaphobacter dinghuensis]|uniref:replication-relaxation family protein n=1 Tax=Edaphobacter dinghuensis TaxID=1560005 RepID=UPI001E301101|nr:replication-relaxation family protein [Edaphobacter dinghuensis]
MLGMRYFKGYLDISDDRDVPVLLLVRNARAISFRQLRDLLMFEGTETSRRSVDWRVARLEKHGLIQRVERDRFLGEPFFVITGMGLRVLESRGHSLIALPSTAEQIIHHSQVPHAIELTRIRLALLKHGLLRSWLSDLEIVSRNTVLEPGTAKDFDAVAEILVNGVPQTFAIEYERTPKGGARYREICRMLDHDRTVDIVLYLASERNVLYLLAEEMRAAKKRIGITLCDSFRQNPLEANTLVIGEDSDIVPFRALLANETAVG